jgi:hypothetical protein
MYIVLTSAGSKVRNAIPRELASAIFSIRLFPVSEVAQKQWRCRFEMQMEHISKTNRSLFRMQMSPLHLNYYQGISVGNRPQLKQRYTVYVCTYYLSISTVLKDAHSKKDTVEIYPVPVYSTWLYLETIPKLTIPYCLILSQLTVLR